MGNRKDATKSIINYCLNGKLCIKSEFWLEQGILYDFLLLKQQ